MKRTPLWIRLIERLTKWEVFYLTDTEIRLKIRTPGGSK